MVGRRGDVGRRAFCGADGVRRALGVVADVVVIEMAAVGQMGQQAIEEPGVAARSYGEMQVGLIAGGGAARVDDDEFHLGPLFLLGQYALMQDGMGPGGVGADHDHQIGQFHILVAARDHILAEGADVGGDGGGHAQARVGVDVGAAEKPLPEFVGDVVVLGAELA